jgi:hypothetical protein
MFLGRRDLQTKQLTFWDCAHACARPAPATVAHTSRRTDPSVCYIHLHASQAAPCVAFAVHAQVKSFEADIVEAQGYKGAIAAADELKGLLEGSKAVGSRKGLSTEQQAAYSSLPQVRTAAQQPAHHAYG